MNKFYMDEDRKTITIDSGDPDGVYTIDLNRCENSSGLLDIIMQIYRKRWCDAELFYELIGFIDESLGGIQSNLCPYGSDKKITDWDHIFSEANVRREVIDALVKNKFIFNAFIKSLNEKNSGE